MNLTITIEPKPLVVSADNVILVRGTRVPLDTIVLEFKQGVTAQEIAEQYASLDLADVMLSLAITCGIKVVSRSIYSSVRKLLKQFTLKTSVGFRLKDCAIVFSLNVNCKDNTNFV